MPLSDTANPTTAQDWDAHASDYTRLFSPLTGHVARGMLALVQGRLPANPRILDIACGPGDLAVAAANLCAHLGAGSVLATDISPQMVDRTAKALAPINAEAQSEVHDGQALKLERTSFDAALSCFGIFLFPDRLAGWRSAANTIRPGGYFVTSVWRGPEFNELASVQMGPLMSALPARLTEPRPQPGWAELASAEGLIDGVTTAAPLVDAEIHISMRP